MGRLQRGDCDRRRRFRRGLQALRFPAIDEKYGGARSSWVAAALSQVRICACPNIAAVRCGAWPPLRLRWLPVRAPQNLPTRCNAKVRRLVAKSWPLMWCILRVLFKADDRRSYQLFDDLPRSTALRPSTLARCHGSTTPILRGVAERVASMILAVRKNRSP
jgi:hypothetical protein